MSCLILIIGILNEIKGMKISRLKHCIGGIGFMANGVGGTESYRADHVHGRPGTDGARW